MESPLSTLLGIICQILNRNHHKIVVTGQKVVTPKGCSPSIEYILSWLFSKDCFEMNVPLEMTFLLSGLY